jgi:hypothetical protein
MEKVSPALRQQWKQTGKQEPRRFQCSRCGGIGNQEAGCWNAETNRYDAPAGVCDLCHGEGYLGFMPSRGR